MICTNVAPGPQVIPTLTAESYVSFRNVSWKVVCVPVPAREERKGKASRHRDYPMQTEGTKLGEACGDGRWQQVTSRINIDGIKGNEPLARAVVGGSAGRERTPRRRQFVTNLFTKLLALPRTTRPPATRFTIISLLLFSVSIIVSLSLLGRAVHFHACDA